MYGPTTEEDPGPARGARSSLAAYCNLGRLPLPRRVLKGLQLVSPGRGGRARRGGARVPGPGSGPGGSRAPVPGPPPAGWGGRPAASPPRGGSGSGRLHSPVPAAATPPAGRPPAPRWVPAGGGGPLNALGGCRKEFILIGSTLAA